MIDQPIYCLTSDIDWASDFCIEDLLNLVRSFGVTPTFFATHDTPILKVFYKTHPNHLGVHPNFRVNSTHGTDYLSVIDHVFRIYPNAKTFRSHAFYDSSDILQEISRRGVKYDSNLCLYLQPNIVPLNLGATGITRFPVFWEDDTHWIQTVGDWQLRHYLDAFTSPGLKIINVHPFMIAANIPSEDYYLNVKQHIRTLANKNIDIIRYNGYGARTFLIKLLKFLKSKNKEFHTLHDLYKIFPIKTFLTSGYKNKNRQIIHTKEDY
jgi:hypothetical protein